MKKIILLTLMVACIVSCNCNEKPIDKIDVSGEKEQINTVLDAWHEDAAKADFEAYFGAMSTESIFVGTDAAEVWNLQQFKAFSKPYFDKGQAWSFTSVERNIYINDDGKTAWFDELLDTWMGVCRSSGVLKRVQGKWEIVHYVLSMTVPNDNIQEVIKVNKVSDSLFLMKYKN